MSEFVVLFETVRGLAWIVMGVLFGLAVGLVLFDRPRVARAVRDARSRRHETPAADDDTDVRRAA
jgi:hypothetical protein